MIPRYPLEIVHKATNRFRFQVTRAGVVEDLSTWSNLWCGVKRTNSMDDTALIYEYVLFAGVEVTDAVNGMVEVTFAASDGSVLTEGIRHNLVGDVGGTDGDFNTWQLFTLAITAYPRTRRSSF